MITHDWIYPIMTLNARHTHRIFIQLSKVRVVLPQSWARRANVRHKSPWITDMQIPDRRREHHNVAGRKEVFKNETFFGVFGLLISDEVYAAFSHKVNYRK